MKIKTIGNFTDVLEGITKPTNADLRKTSLMFAERLDMLQKPVATKANGGYAVFEKRGKGVRPHEAFRVSETT